LDLNQLLGIGSAAKNPSYTGQLENGEGVNSSNNMMDITDDGDGEEDEEEESNDATNTNGVMTTIAGREEATTVNSFQTVLVEFLLVS
jgi:hypothetical protein